MGYLVQDKDPPNPCEDFDGEGKIYSCLRDAGRESQEKFREHVSEEPRLGWRICAVPGGGVYVHPRALPLDVYIHSGEVWALSASMRAAMFPDQRWDVSHLAGVWVADDCCMENIRCQTDQHLLPEDVVNVCYESHHWPDGKCITRPWQEGDPEAYKTRGQVADEKHTNCIVVKLRIGAALQQIQTWKSRQKGVELPEWVYLERQRLVTTWSRGYKSFKSAYAAAFKFLGIQPTKEDRARAHFQAMMKYAEDVVEQYNMCLAGDVWGVCVDVLNADLEIVKDDSCWGYIGGDWAMTALRDQMEYTVKYQEKHADGGDGEGKAD